MEDGLIGKYLYRRRERDRREENGGRLSIIYK